MISLLFHILLLFQSIRAIDTGNCNKLWGMSNTINNINLYSMDLYMCESHIGEKIKESNINSPSSSSNNIEDLNELNSFLSKTFNISTNETGLFNKSTFFLNNNTKLNNITYQTSYNISKTNISTIGNTSQLYNIYTPSSYVPSSSVYSPSVYSPSVYSPSPINTQYPSPSSNINILSPSSNNIDEQNIISSQNVDRFNETERKENNSDNLSSEANDNTFIIITIILSSILLILLLAFLTRFFLKKKTCNLSLKTVPEEKKEEVDLEIGEKNKKINKKYTETPIKKNSQSSDPKNKPLTIQKPSISSAVPITKQRRKIIGGRGKNAIRKTKLNLKTVKQFGQRKNDKIESPAIKKVVNKDITMYKMKSETQEKLKAIEKKNNLNTTDKQNDENEII